MARPIHINSVHKEYRSAGAVHVAVDDLSLSIPEGSFTTLVGPSGCGKTTTLRMIAGLETPSDGRIAFGEQDVTDLSPQDRNCAMVFQSIALYPHMTVRQNIGYGLKVQGVPRENVRPVAFDDRRGQKVRRGGSDESADVLRDGAVEQLARRGELFESSAVEEDDVVAHRHRLRLIVRDVDHRRIEFLM